MLNLVTVKTFYVAHMAHLDKAKLADEGIQSVIENENTITANPFWGNAIGGIKLMVEKDNVEAAMRILRANESDSLPNVFDEKLESLRACPRCGSVDVEPGTSPFIRFLFTLLFFVPFSPPTNKFVCRQCSHKWNEQ